MMIPATILRLSVNSLAVLDKTLLIKTPNVENTTENPKTKNIVFSMMLILLIDRTVPLLEPNSVTVVPEMYARKAGIIGRIHGAINELRPATSATRIVGSAIVAFCNFSFKAFFHILPKSNFQSLFNWAINNFDMNKRFIIVGIALGIVVAVAVIIGSPAIGGFDGLR